MFGLCFRIQVRVLVHQIPHAHVLLAEGVILIKRLVAAMLTGRKQGLPEQAIPSARPIAAVLLLLWVGAASWWIAS